MKGFSFLVILGFAFGQQSDVEFVNCPIASRIPEFAYRDVSALGVAIIYNSTGDIETFLNSGCDVNYDGVYREYETTKCESKLLEDLGFDCRRTLRYEGYTPLNLAAIAGSVDTVRRLLQVPGIDINKGSTYPSTPLTNAAGKGNLKMVQLLVDAGADINALDGENRLTILMSALTSDSLPVVKYILGLRGIDVNAEDKRGFTAVAFAMEKDDLDFIRALVDAGADVTKVQGPGKEPPLNYAARFNKTELAKYLLPRSRIDAEDVDGFTALFRAAKNGRLDIISLLLEAGAKLDYKNSESELTALIGAVISGNAEAVSFLIRKGADVNHTTTRGFTPVYYAAEAGNLKVVKVLVEEGADVNVQGGPLQWSPIMKAAYDGNAEIVEYLKNAGADLFLEDKDGDTALDLAELKDHYEISRILREK